MKSRTLIEKALLNPINVNGKIESLASFFIEFNELNKGWASTPALRDIKFYPSKINQKFTRQQDSIINDLYGLIIGADGVLSVYQKDKKVSIINIEARSTNELFSKEFVESIAKEVSTFYVETKSGKAKRNVVILQRQVDSIRNQLNAAINGVAVANDNVYNLNTALNVKRTPSSRKQVDVQANTAILTQLVTNLEMAKVTLLKETPLVQVIDRPVMPLAKYKLGKLRTMVKAGIIAGFLSVLILIAIRILKKLL
jgi:hypothetical protein